MRSSQPCWILFHFVQVEVKICDKDGEEGQGGQAGDQPHQPAVHPPLHLPDENVKLSQPQSHCHTVTPCLTLHRETVMSRQEPSVLPPYHYLCTGGSHYIWYTGQVHTQVTGTGVCSGTLHCSKGTLLVRKCILHPYT